MKKQVNLADWSRKKAYKTFCDFDDPYTGITTTLDITNLVCMVKNANQSLYGTMTYLVLMSMNEIDAFKYGYGKDNGKYDVYKYDDIAATVTVLTQNHELNFTRYIKYDNDYLKFMKEFNNANHDAENGVDYYKISNLDNMNKIQVTCLPWIKFNNFKDASNNLEKSSKPKVCWGKYYKMNDKYLIDFSILVNHAFQDGYHIGLLINTLQENILQIDEILYEEGKTYVKRKKKY